MKVKNFKNLLPLLFGSSIILSSTVAACTTNVNVNNRSTINKDISTSSNKSSENNIKQNGINELSADASLFLENGSGVKGKLFYTVDESNNLTITGYDENFNASIANFKSQIIIDNNQTYTLVGFGQSSILHRAFAYCQSLTQISIPSSVNSIVSMAFFSCNNLKFIEFESNSQLQTIEQSVFYGCTSLTEISIPSSVSSIGQLAFCGCTNVSSIEFQANSQLHTINSLAFANCLSLTEITIPSSVTSIGDAAFAYNSISNITLEEGNQTYNLVNLNKNGNGKILVTKDENPDPTNWNGIAPVVGSLVYGDVDYTQFSTVTTISNSCFQGSNINSVKISSNISFIGYGAFNNCLSLKSIEFESNSQLKTIESSTFSYCTSLTEITIPSSVSSIDYDAFSNCSNLTSIEFEQTSQLREIELQAFGSCTSLTEISIPSSVTSIGDAAFAECTNLKIVQFESNSQLEAIGLAAFRGCTSLTEITIPSSVTSIGDEAFAYNSISNITLEEGNQTYNLVNLNKNGNGKMLVNKEDNQNAISWNGTATPVGCLAYGDVDYTQYPSVTNIPDFAFTETNINSVEISSNILSIGHGAFLRCLSLKSIEFESNSQLKTIENITFSYCTSLTEITIPSTVTSIANTTFAGCYNLKSVQFEPNSQLQTIESNTFSYCTSLTEITIPSSVSSIGLQAFYLCTSLAKITIPSSVTTIGDDVFSFCNNLSSMTFLWSTQKELDNLNIANNWFNDDGYNGTVYVPTGTIPLYNQYAKKLGIQNATIKEIPQPKEVNVALVTWLTLWVGLPTIAVIIAGIGYYNSIKKHKK